MAVLSSYLYACLAYSNVVVQGISPAHLRIPCWINPCSRAPPDRLAKTKMKAVVTAGLRKWSIKEVDKPKPGPKEILVKVVAAAQNPADCTCRESSSLEMSYLQVT